MEMSKFKKGERIEVVEQEGNSPPIGSKGKVVYIKEYNSIVVEFDDTQEYGNTCGGYTKANHGYTLSQDKLELEGEVKPVTHIVTYCKSSDPHIICRGEEEARKTIKKLWNDKDVVKTSIRVFEAKELSFEFDIKFFGLKKEVKIKQ